MATPSRAKARARRHCRIRRKISGTAARPRMAVCTTGKHIYIQFVDDEQGRTLVAASTCDRELRGEQVKANLLGAQRLGKVAAERALAKGITKVVFDRGGCKYHGRIKAVAEAARAAKLEL